MQDLEHLVMVLAAAVDLEDKPALVTNIVDLEQAEPQVEY
jgi:hypothetical protein